MIWIDAYLYNVIQITHDLSNTIQLYEYSVKGTCQKIIHKKINFKKNEYCNQNNDCDHKWPKPIAFII